LQRKAETVSSRNSLQVEASTQTIEESGPPQ